MNKKRAEEILSDYLEATEHTKELLLQTLLGTSLENNISDEDKLRAAYALNMCTVSISQIVDYNDINILEQEYEAILNNLNLEQIPKDEALLHILRQILDTITYFRIEEVEKEFIEKEYQQKMKNAIWSAVPNFGVLVAGGSPITAAISLASQVGIGYMNYRRNKAEYKNQKEKQLWQLRRTAIEQFNGLRRELFDTAWRLADEYNFPDEYRLTEKQIAQYNKILMDDDEIRKYERLYSIRDKFEAYPPFWYFIGNTAKRIAENDDLPICEQARADYRRKALGYFEKYSELNKFNILREDQLAASCALEHVEILLLENNHNKEKIHALLESAVKYCGNANDVLQICAVLYLKNGESSRAAEIFRMLVNEDYNRVINAQLLSSIYVKEQNRTDYDMLSTRVDADYLYPMPSDFCEIAIKISNDNFESNQRSIITRKFEMCLTDFINKYTIEWNKITSVFEEIDYPDSFFLNTKNAKEERLCQAQKIFSSKSKSGEYRSRLLHSDFKLKILEIINEMYNRLFSFELFADQELRTNAENSIQVMLERSKEDFKNLLQKIDSEEFDEADYKKSQESTMSLPYIFSEVFSMLCKHLSEEIKKADIEKITEFDSKLSAFCSENGLVVPEITTKNASVSLIENQTVFLPDDVFGNSASSVKRKTDLTKEMISCIQEHQDSIDGINNCFFAKNSPEFKNYFDNEAFIKKSGNKLHASIKSISIAVYKDEKFDLIFTNKGLINVAKNSPQDLVSYNKVSIENTSIHINKKKYVIPPSIAAMLRSVIQELRIIEEKYNPKHNETDQITETADLLADLSYNEPNIEYIKHVTAAELNKWFMNQNEAMDESAACYYAIATPDRIKKFGFKMKDIMDSNCILQGYYNSKLGSRRIRVVKYDTIEADFQRALSENNGFFKVGK